MTDPLTPPLQDSLAVALRTSLDDPALVNEPVTLPDLADVLSEVWRDDVLRQGHPEVPLAAASMRVYPSMSPSSHTRCDGFQVEVSLPGRAARSHPFSIHSLRHVAERAVAPLLKAEVLKPGQQYYYEVILGRSAAAGQPSHSPTGILSVRMKTAPLRFLKVSLRDLLAQATPVDLLDDGAYPVFFTHDAFTKAEAVAYKGLAATQPVETGCVLIGSLALCEHSGELCAIIREVIEVQEAEQTQFTLSYSSRSWGLLHTILRARQAAHPADALMLMGQAHLHPFTTTDGKICAHCDKLPVCNLSSAFVSPEDRNWHRAVFARQPWALCHIFGLSPRGERVNRLFGLQDGRLQARGYYVLPHFESGR